MSVVYNNLHQVLNYLYEGRNLFLSAPGGYGKSYCINELREQLEDQKNIYLTAPTGIAAYNIGGQTLHRFAGVGLAKGSVEDLVRKIRYNGDGMKRWIGVDILIIDEISMVGAEFFEKLDAIAKLLRHCSTKPFGGIQLIVSGDFLQLPPINDKWVFHSDVWKALDLQTITFTKPMRFSDPKFSELLLKARVGRVPKDDYAILLSRFKEYVAKRKEIESWPIRPTILHPLRKSVDEDNALELSRLTSPEI